MVYFKDGKPLFVGGKAANAGKCCDCFGNPLRGDCATANPNPPPSLVTISVTELSYVSITLAGLSNKPGQPTFGTTCDDSPTDCTFWNGETELNRVNPGNPCGWSFGQHICSGNANPPTWSFLTLSVQLANPGPSLIWYGQLNITEKQGVLSTFGNGFADYYTAPGAIGQVEDPDHPGSFLWDIRGEFILSLGLNTWGGVNDCCAGLPASMLVTGFGQP